MQILDRLARALFRRSHLIAVSMVMCLGALVFIGWYTAPNRVHNILPQFGVIKMLQSLGLPLAAISLWLWQVPEDNRRVRAAQVCGGAVISIAVISGLYSLSWIFGANTPSMVKGDRLHALVFALEQRWALTTTVSLCLAGGAMCVLDCRTRRGAHPAEWLALLSALVPFTLTINYIYSGRDILGMLTNPFSPRTMLLFNVVGLLMLSVSIFTARPGRGWMAYLVNDGPEGVIARRLLPAGIVILVGVGTLTYALRLSGLRLRLEGPVLITLSVLIFGLLLRQCINAVAALERSRKAAEMNLQNSEERLRMALDAARVGTWDMDVQTHEVWWSGAFDEIVGFTPGAMPHRYEDFQESIHPDDREMVDARIMRALQGVEDSFHTEHRIFWPDGNMRWVSAKGRVIRDETGEPVHMTGTIMDITERRLLEGKLIEVSNREQRRLGQDLHDDLGQWLTAIHLEARALAMRLKPKSEADSDQAEKLAGCAREALERARMIARGLAPAVIESSGLAAALDELAANTERMFRVECQCACAEALTVRNPEAALHLYRIAQEAISNALRHGNASKVWMSLEMSEDRRKCLVIRDNGMGIAKSRPQSSGLGLRIMQYRAELLGAELEILSAEEGGAEVRCCFPADL